MSSNQSSSTNPNTTINVSTLSFEQENQSVTSSCSTIGSHRIRVISRNNRFHNNMNVPSQIPLNYSQILMMRQNYNHREDLLHRQRHILKPSHSDILCGRNKYEHDHKGNIQFGAIVKKYKDAYRAELSSNSRKAVISAKVVTEIRNLNPPGRFLERYTKSGLWVDIGSRRSGRKIRQALRDDGIPPSTLRRKVRVEPISDTQANISNNPYEAARAVCYSGMCYNHQKKSEQNHIILAEENSVEDHEVPKKPEGIKHVAFNPLLRKPCNNGYDGCGMKSDSTAVELLTSQMTHGAKLHNSSKRKHCTSGSHPQQLTKAEGGVSSALEVYSSTGTTKLGNWCGQSLDVNHTKHGSNDCSADISTRCRCKINSVSFMEGDMTSFPQLKTSEIRAIYWTFKASMPLNKVTPVVCAGIDRARKRRRSSITPQQSAI